MQCYSNKSVCSRRMVYVRSISCKYVNTCHSADLLMSGVTKKAPRLQTQTPTGYQSPKQQKADKGRCVKAKGNSSKLKNSLPRVLKTAATQVRHEENTAPGNRCDMQTKQQSVRREDRLKCTGIINSKNTDEPEKGEETDKDRKWRVTQLYNLTKKPEPDVFLHKCFPLACRSPTQLTPPDGWQNPQMFNKVDQPKLRHNSYLQAPLSLLHFHTIRRYFEHGLLSSAPPCW